jgi:Fe/S biogenesis protein NfuA
MINVSQLARQKILDLMKAEHKEGLALRFGIRGRGHGGFVYRLAFVDVASRTPDDMVVDLGGLQVLVDPESSRSLEGASIDYVEASGESGFKIDNPNPLWPDATAMAVQRVIDEEINPAVAMHGGFVTLLDVKDDIVYIQLGGGCQGCGMVDVTLKQGIVVRLQELVPQIREVIDTTDHADGRNPYYQPARGGTSPLGR